MREEAEGEKPRGPRKRKRVEQAVYSKIRNGRTSSKPAV
jgi:hypothetical protein